MSAITGRYPFPVNNNVLPVNNDDVAEQSPEQIDDEDELPVNRNLSDSTYLRIDVKAAERLKALKEQVGREKIAEWLGINSSSCRDYLARMSDRISMREARVINEKANATPPIFEIDMEHLLEFKVIDAARETLTNLSSSSKYKRKFTQISLDLNFYESYLNKIKSRIINTITKKNAETIEGYFKTKIFYIHQIFKRAKTESITENRKHRLNTPSTLTLVEFNDDIKEEIKNIEYSKKTRINKLSTCTYTNKDATSVRNAVMINEISGSKLFTLSVNSLVMVPYSDKHKEQLKNAIQKKIAETGLNQSEIAKEIELTLDKLKILMNGNPKKIQYDTANKINTHLEKIFDFKKILEEAERDALEFYNSSQREINPLKVPTKKRKITEQKTICSTKKQKPNPIEEKSDVSIKDPEQIKPPLIIRIVKQKQFAFDPIQATIKSEPEQDDDSVEHSPFLEPMFSTPLDFLTSPELVMPLYHELDHLRL
jgi:hypothetical protein